MIYVGSTNRSYPIQTTSSIYNMACIFNKVGYSWTGVRYRYIVKNGKVLYLVHKGV